MIDKPLSEKCEPFESGEGYYVLWSDVELAVARLKKRVIELSKDNPSPHRIRQETILMLIDEVFGK